MSRGKILYVATEDWYFISDTLPLAKAARAKGYDVAVIARANGHEHKITDAGLHFHPLTQISRSGIHPVQEARSIAEMRRVYGMIAPDIVHHIALKTIVYGVIAGAAVENVARVNAVMGLGYVFTSRDLKARILRSAMQLALSAAVSRPRSATILQNSDDLEELAKLSPAHRKNLRLIPGSGVDCSRFTPQIEADGPPVAILPARLLRDKGVVEFAMAARMLKAEGLPARFALVGEPDADNPASVTQAEIDAWVGEGIVEHWGFRTDMPEVYRQAAIVCLPSYYREGLPRVLIEAGAAGRACVTTDAPGCREAVRDGVNGWLVAPRDAKALAVALRTALSDSDRRAKLAANARKLAEEVFAAPIIIAQQLALYDELLARR